MKYVISLSGGLDSATALALLLNQNPDAEIRPCFFHYGSKHGFHEEKAAHDIAGHYQLPLRIFDCSTIFHNFSSALLAHDKREIPRSGYDLESMADTVVPGRNLIFASIMAAWAESNGFDCVVMGMHGGDHQLYPDCRPGFVDSLNTTLAESTDGKIKLLAPFLYYSKARIVEAGLKLGVPYEKTRSCYQNHELACGSCGTCRERLEAFAQNGVKDPILYQ